jgi:hypothetical protein
MARWELPSHIMSGGPALMRSMGLAIWTTDHHMLKVLGMF